MKSFLFGAIAAAGSAHAAQSLYGQCGAQAGATTACAAGATCSSLNAYYWQCLSATAAPAPATATTAVAAVTTPKTTAQATPKTTTTAAAAKTSTAAAQASGSGKVKYAGVNISGFDFGCSTDGTCTTSGIVDPGSAGLSQMQHFVTQTGLNTFRLPVGWQFLVNNNLGGTLDATNFPKYDTLVQNCLKAGAALCIIDVHNYARWNGNIIGQSSVTNAQFSSLWSQLAKKYANNAKIAFGIMNEPHDLTVSTWGTTVQAAVTAIRQAGATSNMILLPGSDYTHASTSVSDGSFAALKAVKNLDGSTTNLIFDVHQYLDSDGSGTSTNCVTNNADVFTSFASTLRSAGRQAMLTETGGGPSDSTCLTNVCQELQTLSTNSDVYLGWTGWAAGEFDTSYTLSETPMGSPGSYTDQKLVTQCIAGIFKSG